MKKAVRRFAFLPLRRGRYRLRCNRIATLTGRFQIAGSFYWVGTVSGFDPTLTFFTWNLDGLAGDIAAKSPFDIMRRA